MEILSRDDAGNWKLATWAYVQAIGGNNPCWINTRLLEVTRGDLSSVPVTNPQLPFSQLYTPPAAFSARRDGNMVTVIWSSVYMTEDDYRGYLVEAWVCHNGSLYFAPVGFTGPNTAYPAVQIPDESGCLEPSSGRLYSAEKHGYTRWVPITWP